MLLLTADFSHFFQEGQSLCCVGISDLQKSRPGRVQKKCPHLDHLHSN